MEIPKKIHQTWYKKSLPSGIQKNVEKIKSLNKDYEYFFYDDNDILNYITKNYNDRILRAYKKLKIGASKADFFRYLVLYKEGGVYLDLDADILKNLDSLIEKRSAVISREGTKPYFVQWMMCFCKSHPLLKRIIEITTENILEKKIDDIVYMTGPWGPYTQGINELIKIDNIWEEKDSKTNEKLKENRDEYLKNTVFYKMDYGEFAEFKNESSSQLYGITNIHWSTRKELIRQKYKIIFFSLYIIFSLVISFRLAIRKFRSKNENLEIK